MGSRAVWELTKALSAQATLPDPCRQIAVLVTGAHFRAGYEIYAYVAVAQRDGLSDATIAQLNFLSDKASQPYMAMADVCIAFGVGRSTASAKSMPSPRWNPVPRRP